MAGRPAKLTVPRKMWADTLGESRKLFQLARPLALRGVKTTTAGGFRGAPARQIIGLAFLRMVGAWERALEDVFLRYLVGAPTSAGAVVVTAASRQKTLDDAFSLLLPKAHKQGKPQTHYLKWIVWSDVRALAAAHFVPNDPVSSTLVSGTLTHKCVEWAFDIRHRVAHPSPKARATFNAIAGTLGAANSSGKLPHGFMVGDLLVRAPNTKFPVPLRKHATIFEAYCSLFDQLVSGIAP